MFLHHLIYNFLGQFSIYTFSVLSNIPLLQESQILQNSSEIVANVAFLTKVLEVCTRIKNFETLLQCRLFLQDSDNISAKNAFSINFFYKNAMCNFD